MYHYVLPKKDNKGIAGAIVGGVSQVVNAYNLNPANTAPPPAGDPHSVSPDSSSDSKPAKSPAFRPKGRMTPTVAGKRAVKSEDKSVNKSNQGSANNSGGGDSSSSSSTTKT